MTLNKQTTKNLIFLFFIALFVFRLGLITKGIFYWWDERMHWFSMGMWKAVSEGNWKELASLPFHPKSQGRPFWLVLNMIPAGFQVLYFLLTGIKTETPESLRFVGVYNVILSMIVVILFWVIARKVIKNVTGAFTATVVYSLLVVSNVNVKHMYPIFPSLVFHLFSFWVLVSKKVSPRRLLISGVLSGLGQITYASFFLFPLFNAGVLFYYSLPRLKLKDLLETWGRYALGYLIPIVFISLWAAGLGTHLYANISDAKTIGLNPSFTEAITFLPSYLVTAEGLMGILLLMLSTIALGVFIKTKKINLGSILLSTTLIAYTLFALSALIHRRVYARVIHIYIIFLILGAFGVLENQKSKIRNLIFATAILTSVVSFFLWAPKFWNLTYPQDVKFQVCGDYYRCPKSVLLIEENAAPLSAPIDNTIETLLVNTDYLHPVREEYSSFVGPDNFELVFATPHPLNFFPYQLEGYLLEERRRLQTRQYQIKVYQRKSE